jgi:hypothetical protein
VGIFVTRRQIAWERRFVIIIAGMLGFSRPEKGRCCAHSARERHEYSKRPNENQRRASANFADLGERTGS